MTLQSDLELISDNAENTSVETAENFLSGSGKTGIIGFLQQEARKGQRTAKFHISNGMNPQTMRSGFATLSGELSIINSPQSPGVQERNGICWIYLNMEPAATIADFNTVVGELITDLTDNDDLDVDATVGATMADMEVSW